MHELAGRGPCDRAFEYHMSKYYAPNFNFSYFGWLATFVLVNQLVTGIWLTMDVPSGDAAFASVEYIMRRGVWLVNTLSALNRRVCVFRCGVLHMYRALIRLLRSPELLWLIGMAIFIALMAEGFFGYLLPWDMSAGVRK